jgi:hypothetical protein
MATLATIYPKSRKKKADIFLGSFLFGGIYYFGF